MKRPSSILRLTKRRHLSGVFFGVALFLFLFVPISKAEALVTLETLNIEAQNDFVVTPGKTEISLNPGEMVTKSISITNRNNRTVYFRISLEDFVGSDNADVPVVLLNDEDESPYSLKDFIKPEVSEFSLKKGEKITIPVTIAVPEDVEPGGHYGAVVIANRPTDPITGEVTDGATGNTKIISRIASLMLVRVNGEVIESGNIETFRALGSASGFYQATPSGFEISFKNTGAVHLVPYGSIAITNIFGNKVGSIPVDAYFALPHSTRYREVAPPSNLSAFAFGKYTATLSLYKGYGNQTETRTISYWVIPWKLLVGGFLILFIIIGLFKYVATRFEFKRKR